MDVDGSDVKELCRVRDHSLSPVWSADGRRVFFTSYDWEGNIAVPRDQARSDIRVVSADGGEPRPLNIGLHWQNLLDVSPDGTRLVFINEIYKNELWTLKNLLPSAKPATASKEPPAAKR